MEPTAPRPLTDLERDVLDFEAENDWWKYLGAKEQAVRARFDMSATRYAQVLNALLERPEAEAHAPQLVHRLKRVRDARRMQRTASEGPE